MWNAALAINSLIWAVLGIFLVYSAGTLVLEGAWHQFLYAALLWAASCFSGAAIATQN
jgi:hypothetical protein